MPKEHNLPTEIHVLTEIGRKLAVLEARTDRIPDMVKKLEMLNDWHNFVSGALWVLGVLASAGLAVSLVILGKLLPTVHP